KLLDAALARLTQLFGAADDRAALSAFLAFRNGLGLATPKLRSEAELADIVASVNPQRLQNSPVPLDAAALATIVSNSLV
ncbi:MAG: hypothetical protein LBI99_08330, partial [Propionibacteriaceae bacterium]|nr:hypothetical protein [Propionibacteriaceae bacterium]